MYCDIIDTIDVVKDDFQKVSIFRNEIVGI